MTSPNRNLNGCPTNPGPSSPSPLPNSGRIRLFSPEGDRSALATISLDTTAVDLAKAYEVDSIYLQIGNLHIRNLSPRARPLFILREFLASLGHSETAIRTRGTDLKFRHLIAFFLGRPVLQPNSVVRSEILIAACDVRKGKLVHRWSRHKCLLYNGCLRIQKEWPPSCMRPERQETNSTTRSPPMHGFQRYPAAQPQTEFAVGEEHQQYAFSCSSGLAGRLDSSGFAHHPGSVLEPTIDFSYLSHSADESAKIEFRLQLHPNTSFKCEASEAVPEEVLLKLPHLAEWCLAGNYIETIVIDQPTAIGRLDLRRTSLSGCFRLPSSCFDQLTFLDIRDNCSVSTVHLTNMPSLQVLHCERLQLTSLHLNGQNLTHLHAHHNMLDCLIIMPVPLHLVFIDISHNNFDSLPDWLCDLPQIDCLRVSNNRLSALPDRIFAAASMRYLYCKNNKIKSLPDPVENIGLVSCVVYGNQLTELPREFFRKCSRYIIEINWIRHVDGHDNGSELGTTKPGRRKIDRQTWLWTDEVKIKVREKKRLYHVFLGDKTVDNWRQYLIAKKAAKKAVAAMKAAHYDNISKQLDAKDGGERLFYRLARSRQRQTEDVEKFYGVNDEHGQLITDRKKATKRWCDYFEKISTEEFSHPPIPQLPPTCGPIQPITVEETMAALKRIEKDSCGLAEEHHNPDLEEERQPRRLCELSADTSAVTQHEDIRTHYRPPNPRHHPSFDEPVWYRSQLRDDGCNSCGTPVDRKKQKPLHLAFLDLEKAFDRVPHEAIWYALRWHGVPEELIEWVRILYAEPRSRVQAAAGTSAEFPISVGVYQGSALSPLLFILVMDAITRDLQRPAPWTLLYADDVMLASEQKEDLQRQTQAWSERLALFGLRLNVKKTEYMRTNLDKPSTIQVDGNDLRRTDYFKYLGSTLSADGNLAHEVVARVNATWLKWRSMTGVLCDKNIPERFKSKVYRAVVRSVALYGAECWPATKEVERRLSVMETKMLR
ncbi:hypothetical protein Y032_0403g824 [Ancylostoma ceylanicum]|uniref:Reverse transcriptase domain-containing protein n=1 Tax=Ancylostoma ceylanicum TaxID=53326 RepID=A0A016X4S8_9BILA|nr:hypothetical protein Y032_0403g824 [Ancylostoma ceylanicum]